MHLASGRLPCLADSFGHLAPQIIRKFPSLVSQLIEVSGRAVLSVLFPAIPSVLLFVLGLACCLVVN